MAGTSKNSKRTPQTTIIKVGANELGKLPPQAPELEDSVLGALMIEKDAYGTVADLLRPEVFYKDQNRMIFEAIRELAAKDQPIDALSVGFTIADYDVFHALVCAFIIAAVTFGICISGVFIGRKAGAALNDKASIVGGVILIVIGVEIFITGVFF